MEEKSGSKKSFIIIGVIAILLIAAGVIMFVTKDRPTGGDVVPTNEPQTTETTEVTPTPESTEETSDDVIVIPKEEYDAAQEKAKSEENAAKKAR